MATEFQIEFARAKASGWIDAFAAAGAPYGYSSALLMGLASRETNMKNMAGDFHDGIAHGYGLLQVDIGTDREFCLSGAWHDPLQSIKRGVAILHAKQIEIENGMGRTLFIRTAAKTYSFVGAQLSAGDENRTTIAAYNGGLWAYYGMTVHGNPDIYTTQHNYSADVISRMGQFATLLAGG